MKTVMVLLIFLSGIAVCSVSSSTGETPPQEIVFVRQRVDADYVKQPTEQIKLALKAGLENTVEVQHGDTLSGLISRQYKVGRSNARENYKVLEDHIKTRNQLPDRNTLTAGTTLVLPDLPPLSKQKPSRWNRNNRFPKLSVPHSLMRGPLTENKVALIVETPNAIILDTGRVGAREVDLLRPVSLTKARELKNSLGDDIEADNLPIDITLASQGNREEQETPFTDDELAFIQQKISGEPKKRPTLIVLDDEWPDDAEFQESKAFMVAAITKIRQVYKMGDPSFPPQVRNASLVRHVTPSSTSGILPSLSSSSTPALQPSHASQVKRSIAQLRALECGRQRVAVIYLPLFRSQMGADEILRELIEINEITRRRKGRPKDPVPGEGRLARNKALTIINNIACSPREGLLRTDQAVLEAVLQFMFLFGNMTEEPIFLNMSWTTPHQEYQIHIPPDIYGLCVAAAGNEGDSQGTTVYDLKHQFAYRSLNPGDILAVMNIRADGTPACQSSLLKVDKNVTAFGFSGALSDTECGTSFAAPRVAWLIAAREAMAPKPSDINDWISNLHMELREMREPNAASFNKIRLNIRRLFAPVPDS